jgi:hypothetical protein
MESANDNLQQQRPDSLTPKSASAASEPKGENKILAAGQIAGFRGQGAPCPECGGMTIKQSGCFVCMSCGWARCG